MALSEKNFSVQGVQEILDEGNSALEALSMQDYSSNLLLAIDKLKQKINFAIEKEEELLQLFTPPNDRASIRERIIKYNSDKLRVFSGEELKREFINSFKADAALLKKNEQEQQNLLAEYLVQQINSNINIPLTKAELTKEIANQFNTLLTIEVTQDGARATTSNNNMIVVSEDKIPQVVLNKITPSMRERLQEILNGLNGKQQQYKFPNLTQTTLAGFNVHNNIASIEFSSQWLSNTKGLKSSEIKKLVEENPTVWRPALERANANVLALLKSKVDPSVQSDLEAYVKGMLQVNEYMFFIGRSTNEVTGLLGEIAAALAIQELTGKKISPQWVAGRCNKGKKVSIDLVLKEILGINVKNTTSNFLDQHMSKSLRINFVDKDAKDVLNTLLGKGTDTTALSNAFQTSYFNVSYQIKHDRPHVYKADNENFDGVQAQLQNFQKDLVSYLYQFAPEMLYMVSDDLEKQLLVLDKELSESIGGRGNILYLVGGVPFFPSEMLLKLRKELEDIYASYLSTGNKMQSSLFKINRGSSENIVTYLNEQAIRGVSVKLSGRDNQNIPSIRMTSSWLFKG